MHKQECPKAIELEEQMEEASTIVEMFTFMGLLSDIKCPDKSIDYVCCDPVCNAACSACDFNDENTCTECPDGLSGASCGTGMNIACICRDIRKQLISVSYTHLTLPTIYSV